MTDRLDLNIARMRRAVEARLLELNAIRGAKASVAQAQATLRASVENDMPQRPSTTPASSSSPQIDERSRTLSERTSERSFWLRVIERLGL